MRKGPSLVGHVFGRLTVIAAAPVPAGARKHSHWRCRCECGNEVVVSAYPLKIGGTRSCGCLRKLGYSRTHGQSRSTEYVTWCHIVSRCENPKNKAFRYYGARGIRVCRRWRESFPAFLSDMGPRPSPEHSVDRIDNDGDYEPANCRWATREVQINNRHRKAPLYEAVSKLAARANLPRPELMRRLSDHWSMARGHSPLTG